MSVVQHAPLDAAWQPISLDLDLLGLELAATGLELDMITQELRRDAREVLAIMNEDVDPQTLASERPAPAARIPRSMRGTRERPVRGRPSPLRSKAMRRLFVIVPIAWIGLLAGVAVLDSFQNARSLPNQTVGQRTLQREGALASRDRQPATGSARQPLASSPASSSGRSVGVRTFSWPAVPGAAAYEFILLRGQERVFSRRVLTPRLTLPASWRYGGVRRLLRPGIYRWIVLPVRGGGAGTADKAVVAARLVVD
jgi:hypothetical protein